MGLVSLAYLWLRDQEELLDEMIKCKMEAQIVKVCSMGLKLEHVGKTIEELRYHFLGLKSKFGFNVCGEGGEYESAVFDCPLFKTHKLNARKKEMQVHDDNSECPVAYLRYSDFEVVEKTEEERQEAADIVQGLIDARKNVSHQHLLNQPQCLPQEIAEDQIQYHKDILVQQKITLSVSIIDPALTQDEIKAMTQKDQLLMIFDHLKKLNVMPYIVKVGLLVTDLSQFKPLNAEYVKQFGLRPPVRVCIEIPNDEIIGHFTVWNTNGYNDEESLS